jgi:hypothetical protein
MTLWGWIAAPANDAQLPTLLYFDTQEGAGTHAMISSSRRNMLKIADVAKAHAKKHGVSVRLAQFEEVPE